MRRTENNRRPSAGSQPWTSHFRPGRVLRDLLEPMFWGSSAYSDFFGQSTPTTHMPVQRNLRARPCSGRPDQLAGGPRRTCRPWRPVANASRRGRSTRLSHWGDGRRRTGGRRAGLGARNPPSPPHCVPQPATGSSSPTHRFHARAPAPPLCPPTGHRQQFADTPVPSVWGRGPTPRGSRPPAADEGRPAVCVGQCPRGGRAQGPNPCTPHTRGFGPPGGSNRGRQPHVDESAVKVTTFGDPVYSSGRYPLPPDLPRHTRVRALVAYRAARRKHPTSHLHTCHPLPHACRISGHPPQTPDTRPCPGPHVCRGLGHSPQKPDRRGCPAHRGARTDGRATGPRAS